jgi:hypothetical protein
MKEEREEEEERESGRETKIYKEEKLKNQCTSQKNTRVKKSPKKIIFTFT